MSKGYSKSFIKHSPTRTRYPETVKEAWLAENFRRTDADWDTLIMSLHNQAIALLGHMARIVELAVGDTPRDVRTKCAIVERKERK